MITNSLKHAFQEEKPGKIDISLHRKQESLVLNIRDNGNGLDHGAQSEKKSSFGLMLIKMFSEKLNADLRQFNNNGSVLELTIRSFKEKRV